ncbi:hypothetical protein PAXRUDRAFT_28728 [Paxillus rubicundulus Ve08.2h10]|uniref:Unplaced genomic scaffold scaffold_1974, whole genome shotgun sequence n=1 Tax=Paxillus rubicundulus Ve08.2h10 TaxID=930991 RepID=A0A0D0C451_9AGAM|nr:hypothetical protein PAXRUDRAFT_28728 [Paxillus rubicundulus Ve08.2h10]
MSYSWQPTSTCSLHIACAQLLTVLKCQREVMLFTVSKGPCVAKAAHFYCKACQVYYCHNYSAQKDTLLDVDEHAVGPNKATWKQTYYAGIPDYIQVAEHVYIEHQVIDLFRASMEVSWTSATNCARLYNICFGKGKEATHNYPISFTISSDHVWDGFIILSLLEDCDCHGMLLNVPHGGDQNLLDGPVMEEVFEVDQDGNVHPTIMAQMEGPGAGRKGGDSGGRKKKHLCAQFGHCHTFCQEIMVATCGLIWYHTTYYGAEGIASVSMLLKQLYVHDNDLKPAHIFYDNNCHLAKHIKNNPWFDGR